MRADVSIFAALQVSADGDMAYYVIPVKAFKGMGGNCGFYP
jgi:acyl CoA:acetate/3-ketoacid CoA transferase beta subunit